MSKQLFQCDDCEIAVDNDFQSCPNCNYHESTRFIEYSAYESLEKLNQANYDSFIWAQEQNKIMREALCAIQENYSREEGLSTWVLNKLTTTLEKCGSTEPMRKIITEAILNLDGQQARNKDNV